MKKLECVACGKVFIGGRAFFCPECRIKKWKGILKKEAKRETQEEREMAKIIKLQNKIISFNNKYLAQETRCPNYGSEGTNCLGCPDGAYEFKACGQVKKEVVK